LSSTLEWIDVDQPTGQRLTLLTQIFPPESGGSGRWFWEAYRRLDPARVQIVAGNYPGADEFDCTHELRIHRRPLAFAETGTLSLAGMRNYWRVVRELRAIHRQSPFEMLHCGRCITEGWVGWLFRRLTGVPYLCYVHGEDVNVSLAPGATGVMTSRQHRWMAKRVLRDAALLIANSENSRRVLETYWNVAPDRIRVVHPGVDVEKFVPAERSDAVRERFGWTDRTVVLTVGRLQRRKGHDMMLQALAALRMKHPELLYVVAGRGEELESLRQLARSLGVENTVQFRTDADDDELVSLYQQCDLFVLPNRAVGSDIEGFGMVLVEAQACGKPVIAGDSGGTRETMDVPQTGRIVRCEGGPELSDTLAELIVAPELQQSMGRAAREWVCQRFAWDAVVQKMESAFAESCSPVTRR
jgi:phosphatidylinositol alpha-1,6-mannosyltransferase